MTDNLDELGFIEDKTTDDNLESLGFIEDKVNVGMTPQENHMLNIAEDVATAAHQAFTLNQSDEIAGKVSELLHPGSPEEKKIYGDNVKTNWRKRISEAQQRSPIPYFLTEAMMPNVLDVATLGAGKTASSITKLMRSPITHGAAYGYGASSSSDDAAASSLVGGLSGLIPSVTRWGASKVLRNPRATRQRSMGATKKDFEERGYSSPLKIDKYLEDADYFKIKDGYIADINLDTLKVYPVGKAPSNANPIEVKIENFDRIRKSLANKINSDLGEYGEYIGPISAMEFLNNPKISRKIDELEKNAIGNASRMDAIRDLNKDIVESFTSPSKTNKGYGIDGLFIEEINGMKKDLADKGAQSLTMSSKPTQKSDIYADFRGTVNEFIYDTLDKYVKGAGKKLKDTNEAYSRFTKASDFYTNIYKEEFGGSSGKIPYINKAALAKDAIEASVNVPMASKLRTKLGFSMEDPNIRQKLIGKRLSGATPAVSGTIVGSMDKDGDFLGQVNMIPKMLAKTPIPRDSQAILDNKEFVKAKISMAAPALLPYVEHALDEEPEKIHELLPMLVEMAPNMFERDVYNRIDGKINNPMDREKALDDTRKDDALSNSEKAQRANNIAKKGMV